MISCFSLALVLLLPSASDAEPALSSADKKYLDSLMKEFLFDPKDGERVSLKVVTRSAWGKTSKAITDGWLVPGKGGKPARVYFFDGVSIPVPPDEEVKKVDFLAVCKARYLAPPKKKNDVLDDHDDVFGRMSRHALGLVEDNDLAFAAWLHRLGDDALAARALAAARKPEGDPRQRLRSELAWSAYAGLVHAYMVRADTEALAHGEHLLRLYASETKKEFPQAAQILEELKRRQKKGTFGQTPPEKWPDGFEKWDVKKKFAYLIDALEEVDARQWGQPGGVSLGSDRRVAELIRLGDAVVPDLIDVLEKDDRLTRSVHFWRDFASSRTVLSVRETALTVVMSILRVSVFEPSSTGDNFTRRGEEGAKETAKRLRAYWKAYGHLSLDERMMKVLTDPRSNTEAIREAVNNLAHFNEARTIGTTVWSGRTGERPDKPNPVIDKFSKPTVAEAILAAYDRELKAHEAREKKDSLHDYTRNLIEDSYYFPLLELGDRRITPVLARRAAEATTIRLRRKWAFASLRLGDPRPWLSYANDFRAGKIELPRNDRKETRDSDQPGNVELLGIIRFLVAAATPESDRALLALADPKHPAHALAAERVLTVRPEYGDDFLWFSHRFCLRILRAALDDTTATGTTYSVEKGSLVSRTKNGWGSRGMPRFLVDADRRDSATERACDVAGAKIGELVVGLPGYHPLLQDADRRLSAMKAMLDRFDGNYRLTNRLEALSLHVERGKPAFIPDIRPLGRAATAEDVKTGRAVFHLHGKGKPADLKLPAAARWKGQGPKAQARHVLIVQAEVGPEGERVYGVILSNDIRAVPAGELTDLKTFAQLEQEEKMAAEKEKGKKE